MHDLKNDWSPLGELLGHDKRLLSAAVPALFGDLAGKRDKELLPRAHIKSVLGLILETRTGRRPVGRLQGLVAPRLYRQLRRLALVPELRFTLRSVHGHAAPPSAYEVWGTAQASTRTYALTARFELDRTGWRCTEFGLLRQDA